MLSPYFFSIRFRTILNEDVFVETISTRGKSHDLSSKVCLFSSSIIFWRIKWKLYIVATTEVIISNNTKV